MLYHFYVGGVNSAICVLRIRVVSTCPNSQVHKVIQHALHRQHWDPLRIGLFLMSRWSEMGREFFSPDGLLGNPSRVCSYPFQVKLVGTSTRVSWFGVSGHWFPCTSPVNGVRTIPSCLAIQSETACMLLVFSQHLNMFVGGRPFSAREWNVLSAFSRLVRHHQPP